MKRFYIGQKVIVTGGYEDSYNNHVGYIVDMDTDAPLEGIEVPVYVDYCVLVELGEVCSLWFDTDFVEPTDRPINYPSKYERTLF